MQEKINRLKELLKQNLLKEIDSNEWVDFYPFDDAKIVIWNQEIMDILSSINEQYAKKFYNVQKNVSIDFNLRDFKKDENLKASKKCLEEIIIEIGKRYLQI